MSETTRKILTAVSTTIIALNISFGQTIKVDGEKFKLDPETKKCVSMLVDNLTGFWQLQKTLRFENGDTISQGPSSQTWLTPGAKPFTNIEIDSLRNFVIEQACMKCPILRWNGQYEIEIRNLDGIGFFYLNFIDTRAKGQKSEKALTLEFNGHLTNFGNGKMTLRDEEGREWIYSRVNENEE